MESNIIMRINESKGKKDGSCYLCWYHYGDVQSTEAVILVGEPLVQAHGSRKKNSIKKVIKLSVNT